MQGCTISIILDIDIQAHLIVVNEWKWLVSLGSNMHHTGPKFVLASDIGIGRLNEEADEREVAVVGGEVESSEALIGGGIHPFRQVELLLLEGAELLQEGQVVLQCVVEQTDEHVLLC
jgi:hypothetical protein